MQDPQSPALHAFARLTAGATFILIVAGALVTSTESGLAVPDWPLSYGMFFPPMVGGIFYEHGHRMIASGVGLLTLIMAIWTGLVEPRRWVRKLSYVALVTVIVQGLLGGLTVIFLLPTVISVAHATLAQSFFCITIVLALAGSPAWIRDRVEIEHPDAGSLRTISLVTATAVFIQLLLGALMRHTGSGLAIPDFPLAFGRLVPKFESAGISIHFAHRVGAVLVATCVWYLSVRVTQIAKTNKRLLVPALLAACLVVLQIALGAMTVLSRKAVSLTTAHVAVGALLLAITVTLALRCQRFIHPPTCSEQG